MKDHPSSNSMFSVGEVCWLSPYGEYHFPEYKCTEVTIVGPLEQQQIAIGGWAHWVRMCDGKLLCATPRILRKLIPPEQLIEREEMEAVV